MDAVYIFLFPCPVTNGLIIQLSPPHVILQILMGIPPWNISATVAALKKKICLRFPKWNNGIVWNTSWNQMGIPHEC